MDPDALREEVEAWVRDDLITEAQAEAIMARYETADGGDRSRAVVALSVVGAALVFVGVTLFFATNWEDLPRFGRIAVLLAAPGSAYAAGIAAYRRAFDRIGLACCLLGAVLAGPSLFLLAGLSAATVAEAWVLLAWTAIALPSGHALGSRVGVWIGLAVLAALVAELAAPSDPVVAVAALGVGLFTVGRLRTDRVGGAYGLAGPALALFGVVSLTRVEGQYAGFDLGPTAVLVATAAAAVLGAAVLSYRRDRLGGAWAAAAIGCVAATAALALSTPDRLPEVVAFVGAHLSALGLVAATGYVGYRSRSREHIDLAVLAALAQTVSFVASTVVDALSGSIALVAAGVLLLGAGVAIERGRRTLLRRLER